MVNNRRNSDDLGLFYKDFLLKTQKNTHFAKISSKKFAYIKNKQYFCNRFPKSPIIGMQANAPLLSARCPIWIALSDCPQWATKL